jgi:hypothetical protein
LDKNQTKDFIIALEIILIGIFFWILKTHYITVFFLNDYHFLNVIGLEIVGTILLLAGIHIIHRVYPFVYSLPAQILLYLILAVHILSFFFYSSPLFKSFNQFTPFVMSLVLILVSKLMENGIHYFGNKDLSRKWRYLAIIIFFGFSIPYYGYTAMKECGFITYQGFKWDTKIILLGLPVILILFFCALYYIVILIQSFSYLNDVNKGKIKKEIIS